MNKTMKGLAIGIVIGALSMLPVTSLADSIAQYLLVDAKYPIMVDDTLYEGDLPILNYEGYTYVPLRTMSELLNVNIFWNDTLKRVEISHGNPTQNVAFRNVSVTGSQGNYVVTGEARIFEATLQYEVEDGHNVLLAGFETASAGAPAWGTFTIDIDIPEVDLPENGTLTLILFEASAKDGTPVNQLYVPLETFP